MGEKASQKGSMTWSPKTQEFKVSRVHKVPTLISKYLATQFKTILYYLGGGSTFPVLHSGNDQKLNSVGVLILP